MPLDPQTWVIMEWAFASPGNPKEARLDFSRRLREAATEAPTGQLICVLLEQDRPWWQPSIGEVDATVLTTPFDRGGASGVLHAALQIYAKDPQAFLRIRGRCRRDVSLARLLGQFQRNATNVFTTVVRSRSLDEVYPFLPFLHLDQVLTTFSWLKVSESYLDARFQTPNPQPEPA